MSNNIARRLREAVPDGDLLDEAADALDAADDVAAALVALINHAALRINVVDVSTYAQAETALARYTEASAR